MCVSAGTQSGTPCHSTVTYPTPRQPSHVLHPANRYTNSLTGKHTHAKTQRAYAHSHASTLTRTQLHARTHTHARTHVHTTRTCSRTLTHARQLFGEVLRRWEGRAEGLRLSLRVEVPEDTVEALVHSLRYSCGATAKVKWTEEREGKEEETGDEEAHERRR